MKVQFYFDPICPYTWVTSRWLELVAAHRALTIDWQPFSLAIKNGDLEGGGGEYGEKHRTSHRILRVIAAAQLQDASTAGTLYHAFGVAHHIDGRPFTDELIQSVLAAQQLPENLIAAADDRSHDTTISQSMTDALELVGDDAGVPIIAFTHQDGVRRGFFGPVLLQMPELNEALKLWDGIHTLSAVDSFYELKRSRSGEPDIASTAGV